MLDEATVERLLVNRFQNSWRFARENLVEQTKNFTQIEDPDSEEVYLEPLIQVVDRFIASGYDRITRAVCFLHWVKIVRAPFRLHKGPYLTILPFVDERTIAIYDCVDDEPGEKYQVPVARFEPTTNRYVQRLLKIPILLSEEERSLLGNWIKGED